MKGDRWCENCKWWGGERAHQDDNPYGRCRAALPASIGSTHFLPSPSGGLNVPKGEWPWTAFDDWCGSFMARSAP
jgi:hypothetical protein